MALDFCLIFNWKVSLVSQSMSSAAFTGLLGGPYTDLWAVNPLAALNWSQSFATFFEGA